MYGAYYPSRRKDIAKMSAKLDNPGTSARTYWSIISRFSNKRKMPAIPPILADGNWYLISNKI